MAFWLIAAAVIAGLAILAWVSRIRIRVRYSRSGHLDHMVMIVRALYGAVGFKIQIPAIFIRSWNLVYRREMTATVAHHAVVHKAGWKVSSGRSKRFLKLYRQNRSVRVWLLQTLKQVECTRFRLDFRVGTGDAPSTAVISGLLWTVYGCAVAAAGHTMRLKTRPHGTVAPVYNGTEFAVIWEADFGIRLGTALLSVLKLGSRAIRMGRSLRYWHRALVGS